MVRLRIKSDEPQNKAEIRMELPIIVIFDLLYVLLYIGVGTRLKCNGTLVFCSTQPLCDNSFFILCKIIIRSVPGVS